MINTKMSATPLYGCLLDQITVTLYNRLEAQLTSRQCLRFYQISHLLLPRLKVKLYIYMQDVLLPTIGLIYMQLFL